MSKSPEQDETLNSLSSLVGSLYNGGAFNAFGVGGTQVSQSDTMFLNNRWYMISNQRQLISEMYAEHGIVQTLVEQPVDDAFRAGIEVQSGQLSGEDIEKLLAYAEKSGLLSGLIQGCKWARLFGGGGVILITDQDPSTPLDIDAIDENTPVEYRAVDLWELYHHKINLEGDLYSINDKDILPEDEPFDYYGHTIHPSRVLRIHGKAPPSFIRPRLRGWGMSELERIVRSLNQYLKNQNVIFDLLDEAKIDVYKMNGFNSHLLSSTGTNAVSSRIQGANMIKNHMNAITMDKEDDYEQKQMAFAGLSDILTQIRQGICADLKMPVTKLFGVSSAGFNSGEDDIENYNSMVESEVRSKVKYLVIDLLQIACQKVFGYTVDDLTIKWPPLRIMSARDEEEIKNQQYNRITSAYHMGAIDRQSWAQSVNKNNLLPVEIDENDQALEPLKEQFLVDSSSKVDK